METIKRFLTFTMLACITLCLHAQGVAFLPEGATFQQAVEEAKKTNKLVFLDCYTSWCGPCKMMARDVFPQKIVGDFMNPRFVSIKIDMEKGEGPELNKKFGVSAYPTFIIFNGDGKEVGRFLGGSKAEAFIEKIQENSKDNGSADMDRRFAEGDRDPKFLLSYLETLGAKYKRDQCNLVAEALLDGKAGTFASDSTLRMVFMGHLTNPFHETFVYTAKNPEQLTAAIGEMPVRMKLQNVWNTYGRTLVDVQDGKVNMDQSKFDAYIALMEECNVPQREAIRITTLLNYAEKKSDWDLYMKSFQEYCDHPSLDVTDLELCKMATPIVETCTDEELRTQLRKIIEKRIEELNSGKRAPQTTAGNMRLSGNLIKAMEMLRDALKQLPQPSN